MIFTGAFQMIRIRKPEAIHHAKGTIQNGIFQGRWHFSFGDYEDPEFMGFGPLRVLNDDMLSPGAVWPLHMHRDIEVVTYCAEGEFRHADQRGPGGILKQGWVQHTTVGSGIAHSEINNRKDVPMRFIQMWFIPDKEGLTPSVEQKPVEKAERTDRWYPLVSNRIPGALNIRQDVAVFSSFLRKDSSILHKLTGRNAYFYVIEGGPVTLNSNPMKPLSAAMVREESILRVEAERDAELLLVEVPARWP
jgi:redox-sensitive bicupin YhaK (pirin superfamily)